MHICIFLDNSKLAINYDWLCIFLQHHQDGMHMCIFLTSIEITLIYDWLCIFLQHHQDPRTPSGSCCADSSQEGVPALTLTLTLTITLTLTLTLTVSLFGWLKLLALTVTVTLTLTLHHSHSHSHSQSIYLDDRIAHANFICPTRNTCLIQWLTQTMTP
jgi:hypothetical protein